MKKSLPIICLLILLWTVLSETIQQKLIEALCIFGIFTFFFLLGCTICLLIDYFDKRKKARVNK